MEVKVRIAGAAGQGMQTAADLLGRAVTRASLHAYSYSDAESRIRGGMNFTQMRIGDKLSMGVTRKTDILIALSEESLTRCADGLCDSSLILTGGAWDTKGVVSMDLSVFAKEAGNAKTISTIAFAAAAGIIGLEYKFIENLTRETFSGKAELLDMNLKAAKLGYDAGLAFQPGERFRLSKGDGVTGRIFVSGGDAISLGAVAGGVSFIAAYPMSPSTSIMTNLAQWSAETGVVVEQAEDEIAAINMVAGASYAGARAMTATSGGGFSLMNEGLSNIGMLELPAVIVIGQRPGPATGLPTRQAQGELSFARHAGHGHFARVILAPKNIPDCFALTAKAFDIAERYQVPVIILTDQLLQDSYATLDPFSIDGLPKDRHLLTAEKLNKMKTYRRYQQTRNGISPMAAPGVSRHVVYVDSDEHDEDGHMVESAELSEAMASKRARKISTVQEEIEGPPIMSYEPDDIPLIIGYGSTYETIAEAQAALAFEGEQVAHLHLETMWPVEGDELAWLIGRAKSYIIVENSAGNGLESLIRETALKAPDKVINSYDGRPFNVEELVRKILEVVQ